MYYTYILECNDETLYTGSTTDIERRLKQHNELKAGAHYTKIRRPVKLVYLETYATQSEAMKREAFIKTLTKEKKLALLLGKGAM